MALSVTHHRLFDKGALTLSDRILISESVGRNDTAEDWLLRFHDEPIIGPVSDRYAPDPEFTGWHREVVFREPARETA